jgi:ketosteroid isomerase-like protein
VKAPSVEELAAREAIRGVLADYARGIDRLDWDLVRGCYHPDAVDHHGVVVGTVDDLLAHFQATLAFAGTAHYELQSRIEMDGDVARVETWSVAFHWHEPGSGKRDLWMSVRYLDRFECRDGDWRIADRRTVLDWIREVDTPDQDWPLARHFLAGRPDGGDPSHSWPEVP